MKHQNYIIRALEKNISVFEALMKTSNPEEYLFKTSDDKWCLLEIVCHLVDEEKFDFRARIKTALDDKKYPFFSIDPVGWVTERKYIEQDYAMKVQEWIDERRVSIEWLQSLDNPNWDNFFVHKTFGPVSSGHFLANWLAHDHIHIRQINRTKRAYLEYISGENLSYAGKW